MRRVRWFGCGAASAVAIALDLKAHPGGVIAYCETNAEHPDNERFLRDCERWWGAEVVRLSSDEYADTWDVWERERWLAGINGPACTGILKVAGSQKAAGEPVTALPCSLITSHERPTGNRYRSLRNE